MQMRKRSNAWRLLRFNVSLLSRAHCDVQLCLHAAAAVQVLDTEGVGKLIAMAVESGRAARPSLKVGLCGEQGGDAASVAFCADVKLDYVSCSPFRVPLARLAAAQATIKKERLA